MLRQKEEAVLPVDVKEIERLVDERRVARRNRDFSSADRIRKELDDLSVVLEDTATGTRWKRK